MTLPLWRKVQRRTFTNLEALSDFLELSPDLREKLLSTPRFPLNLPYRLAEKIEKNCLEDPIFRQFVPTQEEMVKRKDLLSDPVDDKKFRKTKKILHKYAGRALVLVTSACAMHCRFCFRQ
ncbi:MAG: EF-P beta-lysylation protein EpmB, partial [Chlamydiia bacterium]|nr:EF-P beta-lysylation protein EpmB [Chlamydiia bacterium]